MRNRFLFILVFFAYASNAYVLKNSYSEAFVSNNGKIALGKADLAVNAEVEFVAPKKIGKSTYLGIQKKGSSKTFYISKAMFLKAEKLKEAPAPKPNPSPKPNTTPKVEPAPKPSPQGSKYLPTKKEINACINSNEPVDIRNYYGNTCSDQDGGSCVGQASIRVLDATKVRYRERYSAENLDRMEILAEPFYLKAQMFALLGSGNLKGSDAQSMIDRFKDTTSKGDSFTDGAYPNEYFPAFLRTLQKASMDTANADANNIPVVRDTPETRAIFAAEIKLMNEKIREAYKKWESESGISLQSKKVDEDDLNKLLNFTLKEKVVKKGVTTTEDVSLRKKIAAYITLAVNSFYEKIRQNKSKDLGKISKSFAKDVFYKPLFEANACDPAKLQKTIRYFLCNRIPLVGWGEMKSVGIGGSHAMTVVGIGNGKVTFRNSWGQILPYPQVALTKLCSGELSGLSYLGARGDPGIKEVSTMPSIYRGMAGELTSEAARTAQVNPIPH